MTEKKYECVNYLNYCVLHLITKTCTHLTNRLERLLIPIPYPDYFIYFFISVTSLRHIILLSSNFLILLTSPFPHSAHSLPSSCFSMHWQIQLHTSELHFIDNKVVMRLLLSFLRPILTFMKKKSMKNITIITNWKPLQCVNTMISHAWQSSLTT